MKSYIIRFDLEEEEDGRWSSVVPSLPGCAAWGYTRDEAIEAIRDAAQSYVELLIEDGREIPPNAVESVIDGPAVVAVIADP